MVLGRPFVYQVLIVTQIFLVFSGGFSVFRARLVTLSGGSETDSPGLYGHKRSWMG